MGRPRGFDFGFTCCTKERDGERDDRGGVMIVGARGETDICGLATSWVCRAINDRDLLSWFDSRRDGLGRLKLATLRRRFRLRPMSMIWGFCCSNSTALSSSSDWRRNICWAV